MMDIEDTGKDKSTRLAIIDPEKCKPNKCNKECGLFCPVNRIEKQCVKIGTVSEISEIMCVGCGICEKKCPFGAIKIVNLPTSLNTKIIHRFGKNSFKLHKLPTLSLNKITGLIGQNGIGKSTIMKILSGSIVPNFDSGIKSLKEVTQKFKGNEMNKYFTNLLRLKISVKNQFLVNMEGKVGDFIKNTEILNKMDLVHLLDRDISVLSGGEKQRFFISKTVCADADVYMFDEPSSFLDIKQRINMSNVINNIDKSLKYIMCIDHDLTILDYIVDNIHIIYGKSGAYGIVSNTHPVSEGINNYISGYIPSENVKFRRYELDFNKNNDDDGLCGPVVCAYENSTVERGSFKLIINGAKCHNNEIILLLGENGTGKSTFINEINTHYNCSIKQQMEFPEYSGPVSEYLYKKIGNVMYSQNFMNIVIKPLDLERMYSMQVNSLSGGELQKISIVECLGKSASIYLIDEPSSYLDSEQRIIVSKVIKNFINFENRCAFIVEHDIMMGVYLADKIMVFEGSPGIEAKVNEPVDVKSGMNKFLKQLGVTIRRSVETNRPRINKYGSSKDTEQKTTGVYYY